MIKNEFLKSKEWKTLSRKIRIRDKHCLRCGSKKRLCGDHIIPRRLRPDLELSEYNIQTLCWVCNDFKSNNYIVSFLQKPSKKLLNEIGIEKEKFQLSVRKYARKNISRKDYKTLKGIVDPKVIKDFNDGFMEMMDIPEKVGEKNLTLYIPLFIARFLSLPITGSIMMLTVVADSINELLGGTISRARISEEEINEFVETKTRERFSDWDDGVTKTLPAKKSEDEKISDTKQQNIKTNKRKVMVYEVDDLPF